MTADYKYSQEYREHVAENSPEWQEISARCKERAGHRCQLCNDKPPFLHAHHRTYENLGREQDEDLIALCQKCHGIFTENKRPRNTEILEAFKEIISWLEVDPYHKIQITQSPFCLMKIDTRMGTYGPITAPNLQAYIVEAIALMRVLSSYGAP